MYKFERLPFGVKVAAAIFQEIMDTMLSELDFEVAYLDDVKTVRILNNTKNMYMKSLGESKTRSVTSS